MGSDEQLRIDVVVANGKNAEKLFHNIGNEIETVVQKMTGLATGSKELAVLDAELKRIAGTQKVLGSAMKENNLINKGAAQTQTELARGAGLMANASVANAKASGILAKADISTAEAVKRLSAASKLDAQTSNINADTKIKEAKAIDVLANAIKKEEQAKLTQNKAATEAERLVTQSIRSKSAELALTNQVIAAKNREAKALAKSGSFNDLNNALSRQSVLLKNAITDKKMDENQLRALGSQYKNIQGNIDATNSKFKELTQTLRPAPTLLERLGTAAQIAFGNLVSMAVRRATQEVANFVTVSSSAARQMDGIVNAFAAGTGGFESAGNEMQYVRKIADEMGVSLQAAYDPYSKFMTSFTRSGGSISGSRQIFTDISAAATSLHLSGEQTQSVYTALEQMANKGTVQMEELKRQLGNSLPAAFEIASEAMGVTTAQLTDMMKKGEVISSDFLPKFAAKAREVLGGSLPLATKQAQAQFNRLSTDTFDMQVEFGKLVNILAVGFIPIVRQSTQNMTSFFASFREALPTISGLIAGLTPLTLLIGGKFAMDLIATSAKTGILSTALTWLQANFVSTQAAALLGGSGLTAMAVASDVAALSVKGLSAAVTFLFATPLGWLTLAAVAVGGFAFAAQKGNAELEKQKSIMDENIVKTTAFANSANLLSREYVQLKNNTHKTLQEQERLSEVHDELDSKYPGMISLLDKEAVGHSKITREVALEIAQKQKLAQLAVIDTDYKKSMAKLDKEKWHTQKSGWFYGQKSEWEQEIEINNSRVAGYKKVISQYKNATTNAKELSITPPKLGGLDVSGGGTRGASGSSQSAKEIKDAWEKLNERISIREAEMRARITEGKSIDTLLPKYKEWKDKQEIVNEAMKRLTEAGKDSWTTMNDNVTAQEALIKNRLAEGKVIDDLIPNYVKMKKHQDEVNKSLQELTKPVDELTSRWKLLEDELTTAQDKYKAMLSNSTNYTDSQFKAQEAVMVGLKSQVQYNKALEDSSDLMGMTSRTANNLASDLVDNLFTALGEGETMWDRFKSAGLSAFKALATDWLKTQMNMTSKGFQAGFNLSDKYGGGDTATNIGMGLVGAMQGFKRKSLGGTTENPTSLAPLLEAKTAVDQFTKSSQNLAGVTANSLSPALSETLGSVTGFAAPMLNAADSTAGMAINAPLAAMGTGLLSGSMAMLAPSALLAAPAFTAMAAGLAAIAAPATAAATAMAALAVASAAASVAWIPIAGAALAPAAATMTGGAIASATALVGTAITAGSLITGAGQAIGGGLSSLTGALSGSTKVVKHARGGVVSSPTAFPMQGGNIGVAGEAGTEVIAPARRMSNGDLGVGAVAPNVTVNNYANAAVEVIKRPNNDYEIKITELNSMLASSRTNKGMSAAQSRMQGKGRQVG